MFKLKEILKKPAMILGITAGVFSVSAGVLTCLNTGLKKQNMELYRNYIGAVKDYLELSKDYQSLNTQKKMDSLKISIDYAKSLFSSMEDYAKLKEKNDSLIERCYFFSQQSLKLMQENDSIWGDYALFARRCVDIFEEKQRISEKFKLVTEEKEFYMKYSRYLDSLLTSQEINKSLKESGFN